jgi:hypothetical protein
MSHAHGLDKFAWIPVAMDRWTKQFVLDLFMAIAMLAS